MGLRSARGKDGDDVTREGLLCRVKSKARLPWKPNTPQRHQAESVHAANGYPVAIGPPVHKHIHLRTQATSLPYRNNDWSLLGTMAHVVPLLPAKQIISLFLHTTYVE